MYHPSTLVLALTASLNRELFVCVVGGGEVSNTRGEVRMLSNHRFRSAARAERFRPILDELAALPAAEVAATLNARNVPSPRGGRRYQAQVIRMRKRLAAGPRRKTRRGF